MDVQLAHFASFFSSSPPAAASSELVVSRIVGTGLADE